MIRQLMTHQLVTLSVLLTVLLGLPPGSTAQPASDPAPPLLLTDARLVNPATKTVRRGALRIEGERRTVFVAGLTRWASVRSSGGVESDAGWAVLPGESRSKAVRCRASPVMSL